MNGWVPPVAGLDAGATTEAAPPAPADAEEATTPPAPALSDWISPFAFPDDTPADIRLRARVKAGFLDSPRAPDDGARPTGPGAAPPFIVNNYTFDARSRYGRLLGEPTQGYTKVLLVNGRPLLRIEDLTGDYLQMEGAYASGDTDFFVVTANSSGISCPRTYVVVSLRPGGLVEASKLFGDCRDMYRAEAKGGALLLELGIFGLKGGIEQRDFYTYRSGQIAPLVKGPAEVVSRFGRLKISRGRKVTVDGRQLLDAGTLSPTPVLLAFTEDFRSIENTDYFLVAAVTGETACPLRFVVVSLTPGGSTRSSPLIGCTPIWGGGGERMFHDSERWLDRYLCLPDFASSRIERGEGPCLSGVVN